MTFFKQLSLQLNFVFKSLFFLQYIPHAFFYSLKRDRLSRQYLPDPSANPVIQPGKLLQAKTIERDAYFYFERAALSSAIAQGKPSEQNNRPSDKGKNGCIKHSYDRKNAFVG